MWWQDIIGVAVIVAFIYCFLVIVGFRTKLLTRKTDRTAESMYDDYADPHREHRRGFRRFGRRAASE